MDTSGYIDLTKPANPKERGPKDNPPNWFGGPYYTQVRRGSNVGRHGGAHSGPSGKKVGGSYVQIMRALSRNAPRPKKG